MIRISLFAMLLALSGCGPLLGIAADFAGSVSRTMQDKPQ